MREHGLDWALSFLKAEGCEDTWYFCAIRSFNLLTDQSNREKICRYQGQSLVPDGTCRPFGYLCNAVGLEWDFGFDLFADIPGSSDDIVDSFMQGQCLNLPEPDLKNLGNLLEEMGKITIRERGALINAVLKPVRLFSANFLFSLFSSC